MSDRPSAINGKRNQAWGTLRACPACGRCLCFGCHPHGPCVDEVSHDDGPGAGHPAARLGAATCAGAFGGAWLGRGTPGVPGAAGLRMRVARDQA